MRSGQKRSMTKNVNWQQDAENVLHMILDSVDSVPFRSPVKTADFPVSAFCYFGRNRLVCNLTCRLVIWQQEALGIDNGPTVWDFGFPGMYQSDDHPGSPVYRTCLLNAIQFV